MDPVSLILAIIGLGSQAVGGTINTVAQFRAAAAKEALMKESHAAEKESLAKQQGIRAEMGEWENQDLRRRYNEMYGQTQNVGARRGLTSSSILDKQLNQLSSDLATTLQRRARGETLRTGFEDWSLATRQGLETKGMEIENTLGEAQGLASTFGSVGSAFLGGASYRTNLLAAEKQSAFFDKMNKTFFPGEVVAG